MRYRRSKGRLVSSRGGGGLIAVVRPVLERFGGEWIAAAIGDADREAALAGPDEAGPYRTRLLALPEEAHRLHYDVVCNEHLWYVMHYLFDVSDTPVFDAAFASAWDAYRTVNQAYVDAIVQAPRPRLVFVQDYHLMLVASSLRESGALDGTPLLYFHHTPWSEPDYFGVLPDPVRREILSGLLAHDVVGFHATRWAQAFLACCDRFLPGAVVGEQDVSYAGRSVRVCVAPAPIDTESVRERAAGRRAEARLARFRDAAAGRRVLLRVERIDLSKNVLRGLLAFEQLLTEEPERAQDVWFVALGYLSRPRVARYQRYHVACRKAADRINERFGTPAATPVLLDVNDDYDRSLAGLRLADALLVNPVFDGLNMVAKEGALVNENDAPLILSRNAGVFEELGPHAIGVNPFDVVETRHAISAALEMPSDERARRAAALRSAVTSVSPEGWALGQARAAGASL